MASLNEVGLKYGTDKSSRFHDYLSFYEAYFQPVRETALKILEIGVFNGQSLKTWEEYFPNATIVGVDIVQGAKRFAGGRIAIEIADQSNVQELTEIALTHGPFDIVIEDGSHFWEHQITTLKTIFPFVEYDGLYIVEDLQTNYGSYIPAYKGIASASCMDFLKQWLDLRVADDAVDIAKIEDPFLRTYGRSVQSISFYRRACVIRKDYARATVSYDWTRLSDPPLADPQNVRILAHLSYVGDVQFVNGRADEVRSNEAKEIQGLSIDTDLGILQYKVLGLDGRSSPWVDEGTFLGSRGKSQFLGGLAVRVRSDSEQAYAVRITCRFSDGVVRTATDGEDCASGDGRALFAVQIELTSRPAPVAD